MICLNILTTYILLYVGLPKMRHLTGHPATRPATRPNGREKCLLFCVGRYPPDGGTLTGGWRVKGFSGRLAPARPTIPTHTLAHASLRP